jgi:hypothetical protein
MSMDMVAFSQEASHLALGAFATFCAILLWARTRDIAWTFVIIGAIVSYADIVLTTLLQLKIVEEDLLLYRGVPVLSLALSSLPLLFSGIGFLIAASRRRQP